MKNGGFEKVRGTEGLYRYRPNGKYYARFVVNGKELRQSLETTDQALAKRKLLKRKESSHRIDPAAEKLTIAGLCERYRPTFQHQRSKTVGQKAYVLERIKSEWPGGSDVLIRKVLPSHAQTFLSKYTFGPSSYNAYLGVLRAMFDLAVSDALLHESPIIILKERRREKPIRSTPTWEQFQQIVADVRAQPFNADAQDSADFLEFLGLAGLGQAEASSLSRSDIDFAKGQIVTFRHKTRTGFAIPIYPQVRPLLERLCRNLTPTDKVFKLRDAKKALSGACRRLGYPNFNQRSLRRMFVTRAIEKGIDVKVISQWQGHKDGGKLILDTYSHVNASHSLQMARLMTESGLGQCPDKGSVTRRFQRVQSLVEEHFRERYGEQWRNEVGPALPVMVSSVLAEVQGMELHGKVNDAFVKANLGNKGKDISLFAKAAFLSGLMKNKDEGLRPLKDKMTQEILGAIFSGKGLPTFGVYIAQIKSAGYIQLQVIEAYRRAIHDDGTAPNITEVRVELPPGKEKHLPRGFTLRKMLTQTFQLPLSAAKVGRPKK